MTASGRWTALEIQELFGCSESLKIFHEKLLLEMEEAAAGSRNITTALAALLPFLKMYSSYVNDYPKAQRALEHMSQSQCDYLATLGDDETSLRGKLGLNILLGTPVQRIPRFVMLLQALTKDTPPDHPEYAEQALLCENITKTAHYINVEKRKAEARARLQEIAALVVLSGDDASAQLVESDVDAPDPDGLLSADATAHCWVSSTDVHRCSECGKRIAVLLRHAYRCTRCGVGVHKGCRSPNEKPCTPTPAAAKLSVTITSSSLSLPSAAAAASSSPSSSSSSSSSSLKQDLSLIQPHRVLLRELDCEHVEVFKDTLARRQVSDKMPAHLLLFNDALLILHKRAAGASFDFAGLVRWYSRRAAASFTLAQPNDRSLVLGDPRPSSASIHQLYFADDALAAALATDIRQISSEWIADVKRQSSRPATATPTSLRRNAAVRQSTLLAFAAPNITPSQRIDFKIPSIVRVPEKQHPDKIFSAYQIELHDRQKGGLSATLLKRYSQLWDLKSRIKRRIGKDNYKLLEAFPPKKWFDNTEPEFVRQRCRDLETWLNSLNRVPLIFDLPFFVAFFGPNTTVDTPLMSEDDEARSQAATAKHSSTESHITVSWEEILDSPTPPHSPPPPGLISPSSSTDSPSTDSPSQAAVVPSFAELMPSMRSSFSGLRDSFDEQGPPLATVLYDFDAESPKELSVQRNQTVEVLQSAGEWSFCCLPEAGNLHGWIPTNRLLLNLP